MANIQQQLLAFHDEIKLDDENEVLREKRDIILKKLKRNISDEAPNYDVFVQGSYAMSTGVKPIDGEYDIDVGLWFNMSKDDVDSVDAKKWVYDALNSYPHTVEMKRPCVTVTYKQNGQPTYHVDLTVYATNNDDGLVYLAKGKLHSSPEKRVWEESDPKELIHVILNYSEHSDDRAQFRRVIRYLKRWKDIKFDEGFGKPTGIALTVAAYHHIDPQYTITDYFSGKRSYNDLAALKDLVNTLSSNFVVTAGSDGTLVERICIRLPVLPYSDLCQRMTDRQMATFKAKLEDLLAALRNAENEVDPVEACKILRKEFGEDFPIPPKEETGETRRKAITTHGSGACVDLQ